MYEEIVEFLHSKKGDSKKGGQLSGLGREGQNAKVLILRNRSYTQRWHEGRATQKVDHAETQTVFIARPLCGSSET